MLRFRNQRWAERVGLGELDDGRVGAALRALRAAARATCREPLALRYHGHQFRVYNPDARRRPRLPLRAARDVEDGRLLDLGTKGSGQTPWSRGGDGRLTLKGGVREVLATEMLEALGVHTRKTFSLFETGEELERGDEPSPTRSSVLVRLSHSPHPLRHASSASRYHERRGRLAPAGRLSRSSTTCPSWRGAGDRCPCAFLRAVVRAHARGSCAAGWRPASSTACSTPTT